MNLVPQYSTVLLERRRDHRYNAFSKLSSYQLQKAVEKGDWPVIERLIRLGFDLCTKYCRYPRLYQPSILSVLLRNGHLHCVRQLLEVEEPLGVYLQSIYSVVIDAVIGGDRKCIRMVIIHWFRSLIDGTFWEYNLFIRAAEAGDFAQVESLLLKRTNPPDSIIINILLLFGCPLDCLKTMERLRADLTSGGGSSFTPLIATILGDNLDCLRYLLSILDRTEQNSYFDLAMIYAAALKESDSLSIILSVFFTTVPENLKKNCLYYTALAGNIKNLQLLSEYGCDFIKDVPDSGPFNIFVAAAFSGNVECVKLIVAVMGRRVFDSLIEHGDFWHLLHKPNTLQCILDSCSVDVNKMYEDGVTLLTYAAMQGSEETVSMLLDKGADIDVIDGANHTALSWSCVAYHPSVTRILIGRGADIDKIVIGGNTALMLATRNGDMENVSFLIKAGANLDMVNDDGDTFMAIAARKFFHATFEIIVETMIELELAPQRFNLDLEDKSPLIVAFQTMRESLVEEIISKRYFHRQDYAMLGADQGLRKSVTALGRESLSQILVQFTSRPLSLETWSFLAVSEALDFSGHPMQRSKRVDQLPLPGKWKCALKFQM